MKRSLRIQVSLHAFVAAISITCSATGSTIVSFSLPQTPRSEGFVNGLDGFDFTPVVALTVTALGWYDHDGDGLLHIHPVGIYLTSTRTLVAPAALITNSSILDTVSNFRFETVAPFILSPGVTYTLIGYGEGPVFDPYVKEPSGGITFGPGVEYVRLRTARASGLEFPTAAGEAGATAGLYLGPNFQYLPVPEPTAFCILSLATVTVLALRGRLQSREAENAI